MGKRKPGSSAVPVDENDDGWLSTRNKKKVWEIQADGYLLPPPPPTISLSLSLSLSLSFYLNLSVSDTHIHAHKHTWNPIKLKVILQNTEHDVVHKTLL